MPLDLLEIGTQVRQMGELLARRRADEHRRLAMLDRMLEAHRDRWLELADLAETVHERVAVPTGPLDEHIPPPPRPDAYTAVATDGAEIDPDRHGGSGDFYLINVGRVRIPYGQPGRAAELKSARPAPPGSHARPPSRRAAYGRRATRARRPGRF